MCLQTASCCGDQQKKKQVSSSKTFPWFAFWVRLKMNCSPMAILLDIETFVIFRDLGYPTSGRLKKNPTCAVQAREAAELYRRFFNAELWLGLKSLSGEKTIMTYSILGSKNGGNLPKLASEWRVMKNPVELVSQHFTQSIWNHAEKLRPSHWQCENIGVL